MGNQGKTQFTLLAISKLYNTRINLVGVNENRQWIRPMPVYQSDLFSQGKKVFEVFSVTEMVLNDWWGAAPRAEDRFFVRNPQISPQKIKTLNDDEKAKLLRSIVDKSVDSIFSRGRTLGIIKASIKDVNFRRNLYNPTEYEARLVFEDPTGAMTYNWMVTDLMWHNKFENFIRENPGLLSSKLKETREKLNERESFFVIGLTRVFLEYPGPYGGCWPQVLGIIVL
ncbi:MAG TPA: hypothetical protein GX723_03270 [Thermoanaerobacterales bacterium]|jgi:hypothetical protein|nr:hypothetical protein [Thermoanaerobacterales bacterium]